MLTENDIVDKIPASRVLDTINPLSFRKTANAILAFAPDLLISRFWMPFFAPSLGYVAGTTRKKGIKVISILDNVIPHESRPGDKFLTRYFLKRNDGFVAMTKTVAQDLLDFLPQAEYVLQPHPIYDHFGSQIDQMDARKKLNLPQDKKILLFFGFIRGYKGLDILIESMTNLDKSFHLVIAGEVYGSFDRYRKLIDQHKLTEKISLFIRYIDDHEVPHFFSAADVAVLPYKSATQSGIVQIAYHFDLPAIVTDVGGLSEMVHDQETGLIVISPDPQAVASAVRNYFSDNQKEIFSENIARKKSDYSWHGFGEAILNLFAKIK